MMSFRRFLTKPFRVLWGLVWSRLDIQFKRMCLLASLHASIKQCNESDLNELIKLNKELKLVKDVNALRLPVLLGPIIWKKVIHTDNLDTSNECAIKRIVRRLPCWIKYSDEATMKSDIKMLFGYYQRATV